MILNQDHLAKFKVTGKIRENVCLVYTFIMEKHWKFPLHPKIAFDIMMCHDFDPKSFVQVQSHSKKKMYNLFPFHT